MGAGAGGGTTTALPPPDDDSPPQDDSSKISVRALVFQIECPCINHPVGFAASCQEGTGGAMMENR